MLTRANPLELTVHLGGAQSVPRDTHMPDSAFSCSSSLSCMEFDNLENTDATAAIWTYASGRTVDGLRSRL